MCRLMPMTATSLLIQQFTHQLQQWFVRYGRKDLPWQHPRTPYRVWVAEIMLQQTQVKTVIPYFERFMTQFPTLHHLAHACEDEVLALWSGLGYYSRARRLHQTAQIIEHDYQGVWPNSVELLTSLPGIGRSTAAAIASQAFNQRSAILDGNVKRVLCRYFMIEGFPEQHAIKTKLWELADSCMPDEGCADYTQAIMDLGATCCTHRNPQCQTCPLQQHCLAHHHQRVHEFPYKKIKKKIPTKTQQFLMIYDDLERIYLEKNPPAGIWGSLWCLPRIDINENPQNFVSSWPTHANSKIICSELMQFKHTFSHFHLDIHVVLLEITSVSTDISSELPGQWFTQDEIKPLGIPKPVQTIMDTFFNHQGLIS